MVIERCHGISANAEVQRVTQRKQPGKPHHNIPGLTCVSEKQKQGCQDRKSTRLNSSHSSRSYAAVCLKKKRVQCQKCRCSWVGHAFGEFRDVGSYRHDHAVTCVSSPATPSPEIYTLSLHDALPILPRYKRQRRGTARDPTKAARQTPS